MSKGNIDRRITNLEVNFSKRGEMIVIYMLGVFSHKDVVIPAQTQKEVEALYPDKSITFVEVIYEDPYQGMPDDELPGNVEIFRIRDDD